MRGIIVLVLLLGAWLNGYSQLLSPDELAKVKSYSAVKDLPEPHMVIRLDISVIYSRNYPKESQWEVISEVLLNIGQYTNLQELSIHHLDTSLTEDVEACLQNLRKLKKLQKLTLHHFKLEHFPDEITKLKNLRSLSLSVNVDQLPPDIGKFKKLEELRLSFLPVTTLPKEIGSLKRLKKLNLDYCRKLKTIPGEVFGSGLTDLSIYDSPISAIPDGIGNSIALKTLYLERVDCHTLPKTIGNLSNLEVLWIDGPVKELPGEIAVLSHLKEIKISTPESMDLTALFINLGKLPELKEVNLVGCKFNSIPREINALQNIEELGLDNCRDLTIASIPQEISELKNLKQLSLDGSGITKKDSTALRDLLPSTNFYYEVRYCFNAGTMISMADGSERAIEQLQVGDSILSLDEGSGKLGPATVDSLFITKGRDRLLRLTFEITEAVAGLFDHLPRDFTSVEVTVEHPFYTVFKKWKNAGDLEIGDEVMFFDKGSQTLIQARIVQVAPDLVSTNVVYTIRSSMHTFVANGLVVHNK